MERGGVCMSIPEEYYFVALFDVVLTLHTISFSDATVRDLREQLSKAVEKLQTGGNALY